MTWANRSARIAWVFGQLALSTPAFDPDRWSLLLLVVKGYDAYNGQVT